MADVSVYALHVFFVLGLLVSGESAFLQERFICGAKPVAFASQRGQEHGYRKKYFSSRQLHRAASERDDMDWLSNPLSDESKAKLTKSASPYEDGEEPPDDLGDIQIPSTGISVTDELEEAQRDKFFSEVVPIKGLAGVAQIVTTASGGGVEPVRYLVSLSPPSRLAPAGETVDDSINETAGKTFVMVDIPPFSDKLVAEMRKFMGPSSRLAAFLITSKDAIHYDEAPAVYTARRSDLQNWAAMFPHAQIVGYRLDIPRDCRDMVTQRLDGYGPWALDESSTNVTFIETGRPLTYEEWGDDVAKRVMDEGTTPPDDNLDDLGGELFTPEAIRGREEGKRILALYTPGHTFGSVTYIFPEMEACCSGFTIPAEDDRYDENMGIGGVGPALDFRGYITTSRAGMGRMMESARHIVDAYSDRFTTVLPSRGDPLVVDGSDHDRKKALTGIIDQYDKIGKIYEQLGITADED